MRQIPSSTSESRKYKQRAPDIPLNEISKLFEAAHRGGFLLWELYRVHDATALALPVLGEALEKQAFRPLYGVEARHMGWFAPAGRVSEAFIHEVKAEPTHVHASGASGSRHCDQGRGRVSCFRTRGSRKAPSASSGEAVSQGVGLRRVLASSLRSVLALRSVVGHHTQPDRCERLQPQTCCLLTEAWRYSL